MSRVHELLLMCNLRNFVGLCPSTHVLNFGLEKKRNFTQKVFSLLIQSKRRRRHVSESSDDESETGYQPKKINIAKDYPIGTVLFLENDRRKSSWLPVVVVPTKCVIEECQPSPNPICVRSFRDGRL